MFVTTLLTVMAAVAGWFVYRQNYGLAAQLALSIFIVLAVMLNAQLEKLVAVLGREG